MSEPRPAPSERTRLRRHHERGRYDRETIYAILDATPLAHLGTLADGGPVVTPTFHWREGDRVYWHGSSASRALRAAEDREVCLSVSVLDGLVLARSGFFHSANYRSVTIFGRARRVDDPAEKLARLAAFVEGLYPGRWDSLRPVTPQELEATRVLWLPLDEASAKLRGGDPGDGPEDCALPVWAGVLPVRTLVGPPQPDPRMPAGVPEPPYLRELTLG
jgi:nitroimidazol reductase NimA-like FMN-containing flavoprotein (pyridoxamine 5'-phosphate oxidase superfamily)